MRRAWSIAIAALTLLVAASVTAADGGLSTRPMSDDGAAAIDQIVAGVMADYPDIPGWYIGIWDPERGAYQQAYGLADVANERTATVDVHFRIGSITKTFMATVMLLLVDDGVIGLEATVAEADPDLAATFPEVAHISIRDLLAMTSGIPDYATGQAGITAALVRAPDTRWQPIDLIRSGVEQGLSPVGTSGYSTTNYLILQEIAETLAGRPIQELIREMVTEPLGMSDTTLPYNEDTALPEPLSRGYLRQACVEELVRDGARPVPAGTDTTDWI